MGDPGYDKDKIEQVIKDLKRRWEEETPIPIPAGEKYISFGEEYVTDGTELIIDTRNPKFYPIKIRIRPSMKELVVPHPQFVPCGTTFDVVEVNCEVPTHPLYDRLHSLFAAVFALESKYIATLDRDAYKRLNELKAEINYILYSLVVRNG